MHQLWIILYYYGMTIIEISPDDQVTNQNY